MAFKDENVKREYFKKYYQANKEKILLESKSYYETNKDKKQQYYENNKETILKERKENAQHFRDVNKAYRNLNKEKLQEYYKNNKDKKKVYQNINRQKIKEYKKKWNQENKGKINSYSILQQEKRKLRVPKWLSQEEKIKIQKFYDNCPEGMVVDHIIPLLGKNVSGLHVLSNLQYLSREDNEKKGNKLDLSLFDMV